MQTATAVESTVAPAGAMFPVETFVPVTDWRKAQALDDLASLICAAWQVPMGNLGHYVLAKSWLPPAMRLVDLFGLTLRFSVAPPTRTYNLSDPDDQTKLGRAVLAHTDSVARWVRAIGTPDERQLGLYAARAITATVGLALAGYSPLDHLLEGATYQGEGSAPGHLYPPNVLEGDLLASVRERAHYGRILQHGYPVAINDHCSYCENGLPLVHRLGNCYVCRACDELLADCARCGEWVEKHALCGASSNLCDSCAHGEDDDE
jgi:hypothetical protein